MPGVLLTRGQPAALAVVERAIRSERPPHALLLVGPARVGKTTLALDLAAGLLCTAEEPADRPCSTCSACLRVRRRSHPDLHLLAPIGPGGQVRLTQVHELQASLALHPLEGRWRVAIIEAAHRLNPDAQNALLKTLEEPPARTVIVLAAEDESLLLPTVRSRCARVRLGPVAGRPIVTLLADEAGIDAPRAARLGRVAGGRPGLALALARDPDGEQAYDRLVRTLLDLIGADRRTRLSAGAGLLADAAVLADAADRAPGADRSSDTPPEPSSPKADPAPGPRSRGPAPAERRRALIALLEAWREVARDLAVAAHGAERRVRAVEQLEEIAAIAGSIDPLELTAFLARLDGLAAAIDAYANPELVLDVLLLAWPRKGSGPTAESGAGSAA